MLTGENVAISGRATFSDNIRSRKHSSAECVFVVCQEMPFYVLHLMIMFSIKKRSSASCAKRLRYTNALFDKELS